MRISRILLTGAAVGTMVGTGRGRPECHSVRIPVVASMPASMASPVGAPSAGSQLLGLWLLWRPRQERGGPGLGRQDSGCALGIGMVTLFCRGRYSGRGGRRRAGASTARLPECL